VFVDFASAAQFARVQRTLCWPERRLFVVIASEHGGDPLESALAQLTAQRYGLDELAEVLDGVDEELAQRSIWCDWACALLERDGLALLANGDCCVWFNRRGLVLPPSRTRGTRYVRVSVSRGDVAVLATRGLAGNSLFSSFDTRTFRDPRALQADLDALLDNATEVSAAVALRVGDTP
jgi:hypothetical protein